MANTSTNISLTLPELSDTTKIREDFNDNFNIIDGRFSATYMAIQAAASVAITGGSITGITDLVVADGGTGVSTFTDGGVLLGSGTGAITAMAVLTDGQMIVGNGTTDPVAESGATLRTSIGCAAIAQTMYIGTTAVAINRTSAALTLAGLTLTTPVLGIPTSGTLTNCDGTATSLTAGNATLAATFTCTDNENEALGCLIVFVDGATGAQGAETDGDFTYNPSTGTVVATEFSGGGSGLTGIGATAASALTIDAKEENTSTITKGQPVYNSGSAGVAKPLIGLADCDDATKAHVIGLTAEAFSQNGNGTVRVGGVLTGVDTLGTNDVNPNGETWSAGDALYLDDTIGGLTNVEPTVGHVVEVGHSLFGSNNNDAILVDIHHAISGVHVATGEDIALRMGDTAASNKVYFKDYANAEVGYVDSDGKADFTSLTLDNAMGSGVQIGGVTMSIGSDADGDVYFRNSNVLTRLAKGTNGHFLKIGASIPEWAAASVASLFDITDIPADPNADKYLMWDDDPGELVWGTPAGAGDVSKVATPADNQIGVWTGDGTLEGSSVFTLNATVLGLGGGTFDITRTNTAAGGDAGFTCHVKQETAALTGTLHGAYITASNNQAGASSGTIRGLEVKARTKYPAGTGGTVTVLEGISISADSKDQSVTTMRGIEVMLDGSTGGTVTEGVGIRIANNMQADKTTTMTALQIYSDSFAFEYGIDMSQGVGGITTDIKLSNGETISNNVDGIIDIEGELDMNAHTIGFTAQTATGDGTTTIDWKLGNKIVFTFGAANETFTFTAPTNPCNLLLHMIQDGTGSRLATWPGTVKWPAGTAPTLTTTGGGIDIISFWYDGTSYHGNSSLAFAVP